MTASSRSTTYACSIARSSRSSRSAVSESLKARQTSSLMIHLLRLILVLSGPELASYRSSDLILEILAGCSYGIPDVTRPSVVARGSDYTQIFGLAVKPLVGGLPRVLWTLLRQV